MEEKSMAKRKSVPFSPDDARAIIDAHEIDRIFRDDEELELMEENNPDLLESYRRLMAVAELDLK
jgi:hypothetical protein